MTQPGPVLLWPADAPRLSDTVVSLRGWQAGDAEAVLMACQDGQIQRWTTVPAPYLAEHAEDFVGMAAQGWTHGTHAPFAVTHAGGGPVLGSCGLVRVDAQHRVAEVGYWTAPWARRSQVMSRAVTLLAGWALGPGGLDRLELLIEPANLASCALAERVGAVREGVLRGKVLRDGQRLDLALYALLRPAGPSGP